MFGPWPEGTERIRLFARRFLVFQAVVAMIIAVPVFYLLGFSGPRHHVVMATVMTCAYLALMVVGMGSLYYARKSTALKEHRQGSAS